MTRIIPLRTEIIAVEAVRKSAERRIYLLQSDSHGRLFHSQWQEGLSTLLPVLRSYILSPKIVAIGRNYVDHVKELKNAVPKEPFFFLKPTTSYLPSGSTIEIPGGISAHHEGVFMQGFWSRRSP